jgi:hypothetical protein
MGYWRVTIYYGVTEHRLDVKARDHEQAFWQAVHYLKLDYNRIESEAKVKPLSSV